MKRSKNSKTWGVRWRYFGTTLYCRIRRSGVVLGFVSGTSPRRGLRMSSAHSVCFFNQLCCHPGLIRAISLRSSALRAIPQRQSLQEPKDRYFLLDSVAIAFTKSSFWFVLKATVRTSCWTALVALIQSFCWIALVAQIQSFAGLRPALLIQTFSWTALVVLIQSFCWIALVVPIQSSDG